jgi:hypothetical protein
MTASARRIAGMLRHEIAVNDRHTITTDELERLGEPTPARLPTSCWPSRPFC